MMKKLPLMMMKSSVKIHQFNNDETNEDTRSDVIMEQDSMVRYSGEVQCINPRKILFLPLQQKTFEKTRRMYRSKYLTALINKLVIIAH